MTDLKDVVEPGIWPLVEAANEVGYPTIASCEGHTDGRYAYVAFRADNDDDLRTHHGVTCLRGELL